MSTKDVLLADLYESVLHPDRIPDVLDRINHHLDCDGFHLVGTDEDAGSISISLLGGPEVVGAGPDYQAHYSGIDPRLGLSSPVGLLMCCHDFADDQFVRRSEFYQDFLIPHGLRYVIGGYIYRKGGKNIITAFHHRMGRPRFSQDKRDAASGFMYHLSRWATQLFLADGFRGAATGGFFALDTLGQGILILDDQQHVLFANRATNRLLGDVLTTQGFRRSWGFGGKLRDLLKQVSRDRQARSTTAIHIVEGQTLSLLCSLLPLPREQGIGFKMPKGMEGAIPSHAEGAAQHQDFLPGSEASVLILIRAQTKAQVGGRPLYQQTFSLTAAETRLADALLMGQSPQEYADRTKVSIATVRTQIRALLTKTGASNMRTLLILLAKLPNATD